MHKFDQLAPRSWDEMLRRHIGVGWSPAFLTFMFDQMPGSRLAIRHQQAREVQDIYSRVVTRVVRTPRRQGSQGCLPIWLCAPDFPIRKRHAQSLRDVTINDGQHVHALALTPPHTRLRSDFVTFVEENQPLLTARQRCLRVHAVAVTHDSPYVLRYGLKSDAQERDDEDGFFILPRSLSEL